MDTPRTPPTTAELQAAYQRVGLWRIGMAYTDVLAAPLVLWALKKSVLARRLNDLTASGGLPDYRYPEA
jgi:hypothetical protein